MRIADLPEFRNRTKVLSCSPDDTIYYAVVSMTYRRCGAIVVLNDKGKLAGMFTERDLLSRVVAQGCDVESTKVSQAMTINVETASQHDSVVLTMGRMSHGGFRHMPVVDDKGTLLGMLSNTDFAAYTIREMMDE
jgi:CBS domain-containing protein